MIEQTIQNNSEIQVNVSAAQNGWLVTSNAWYPGWIVLVDGKNMPLLRANYLFQAVQLPAGTHHVEFIYRPMVFYAGACLSLSGLIGVLAQKYWKRLSANKLKKATQI
jgi:uncharacterized membrane protein YfhO